MYTQSFSNGRTEIDPTPLSMKAYVGENQKLSWCHFGIIGGTEGCRRYNLRWHQCSHNEIGILSRFQCV